MALPPVGGNPPSRMAEERAHQAEQEANRRITASERAVQEAQQAGEARIASLHDQYDKRESDLSARQLEILEKQRMRGYEDLRDLQRAQQSELSRVRREGERDLGQLQDHYRDSLLSTEHEGARRLTDLEKQQARELAYQTAQRQDELKLAEDTNRKQVEDVSVAHEAKVKELLESTRSEYERMRDNTIQSNHEAEEAFKLNFAEKSAHFDETLGEVESRAARALHELRRDTSQKLAAYSSRQSDPFYRMLDLNARLSDEGDHYLLTARIPEHEQSHVSVAVKGSQLVLNGYRRNEEKLEIEPGRTRGTNAFQSFLETFPIAWPVDANRMTREFDGDRLTVRVPKKNDYSYKSPLKPAPARVRMERPKFPDNLPLAQADAARTSPEDPLVPVRKRDGMGKDKGSGTLS